MKSKRTVAPAVAGLLAGAAALAAATQASAQDAGVPSCDSYPNPVIITGSSASKPIWQALATAFSNAGVPVSIIYSNPDSCLGMNDLVNGGLGNESSSTYLPPNGASPVKCTIDPSDSVDLAVSDVFPATCTANAGLTIPSSYVDVQGPIQAMTIAVPSTSTASSISAKAAYVVFGDDAATYTVSPWTAPSGIFVRPQTSGTENMIATAIGLVPSKWKNAATGSTSPQQAAGTGNMETDLAGSTMPSTTIGILGAENVDQYDDTSPPPPTPLKILAFQADGQSCGYLPDSSATALDKINVRQGRYAIWGPLHVVVNTNASGQVVAQHAAAAATVLNYMLATGSDPKNATPYAGAIGGDAGTGVSTADAQALVAAEAKPGYVVPWCAMEVMRTSEVGPEASYQSPEPCSCFYEQTLGASVPGHTCTACTSDTDCSGSASTCRYGYCEVQ